MMDGTAFIGELNMTPPVCTECGARHEPEYPHELTYRYRVTFSNRTGRLPTAFDALAHCEGIIYQAAMAAIIKEEAA